jgi:NADPH2:quinone reductase
MKAIRIHEFGPPEVMRLEEVPDLKPGPGQVTVRLRAAGVNPAETYMRSGLYARKPALPYTPGTDAAGIIEGVGRGVTRVSVGDRVYTSATASGAYAQQALCEEADVHPLPEGLSFAQGAALHIPYGTAYQALFNRARVRAFETVLIHGSTGGVGIAAVQLARAAGLTVFGTGGSEKGRRLVLEQGARHVLDHSAPDHLDALPDLTGGRGVDIILEMLANVNLDRDLGVLAPGGRLVVIGSRGRVEIAPRDIMAHGSSVMGMMLFDVPAAEIRSIHAALAVGLGDGRLRPVVGREIPLAEAARAHHEIMEQKAWGKMVLVP